MTDPSSKIPGWAKNIDDYGKRRWNKEKPDRARRAEYIFAIIWNLVWWYIVNHATEWNVRFLNEHYVTVLWALNMNIYIQIGGNILMFVFKIRIIRYLSRIILETANFLVMIIFYYVYPLDFSGIHGWSFLDMLIPWLLIIGMVVSALKVFGNIWKLIFWRD